MKKGKIKKERDRLSIMLVPHSTGNVRAIHVSAFKVKLLIMMASLVATLVFLISMIYATSVENRKLKANISSLAEMNAEKTHILDEKAREIAQLTREQSSLNQNIKDIIHQYEELMSSSIDEHIDITTSNRSGDRSSTKYAQNIKLLESMLNNLERANVSNNTTFTNLVNSQDKLRDYLSYIPTQWPTEGRISSAFGTRKDPFTLVRTYHSGLDIAAPGGQNILAAASGTVIFAGVKSGYGNAVIINHGQNTTTLYGHSSKLLVKVGQKVKQGDAIAKVGSTGRSTGPHLHFEIRLNDEPVDPLQFLNEK